MVFKLKNKELKRIVGELKNASKMHKTQADDIDKHIEDMEKSPMTKKGKKCTCWKGYSRVPGTKPCAPGSCKKNK
jgi:hypothetical protein